LHVDDEQGGARPVLQGCHGYLRRLQALPA
jgi:hypothetical protein